MSTNAKIMFVVFFLAGLTVLIVGAKEKIASLKYTEYVQGDVVYREYPDRTCRWHKADRWHQSDWICGSPKTMQEAFHYKDAR